MGKADLHMHTTTSDGLVSPQNLVEKYLEAGVDVIAVTDHDLVSGGYKARDYVKRKGIKLEVIIGTEVSSKDGHIIALGIEKPLPKFKSAEETITGIHAQGGLAVAAHPMNFLTASLKRKRIEEICEHNDEQIYFDAIETASSYPFFDWMEKKVKDLNEVVQLPELGSSDAHYPWEMATSYTEFEGDTFADLKEAIRQKKTKAHRTPVPLKKYLSLKVPYQMIRSWTWKSPFSPFNPKE